MPVTYDPDADYDFLVERCPDCKTGRIWVGFTCHTYGGKEDGTGWMRCMPCDSARDLECWGDVNFEDPDDNGCGWSYTWGLNPRNPRSKKNEESRPPFIAEGEPLPY